MKRTLLLAMVVSVSVTALSCAKKEIHSMLFARGFRVGAEQAWTAIDSCYAGLAAAYQASLASGDERGAAARVERAAAQARTAARRSPAYAARVKEDVDMFLSDFRELKGPRADRNRARANYSIRLGYEKGFAWAWTAAHDEFIRTRGASWQLPADLYGQGSEEYRQHYAR